MDERSEVFHTPANVRVGKTDRVVIAMMKRRMKMVVCDRIVTEGSKVEYVGVGY